MLKSILIVIVIVLLVCVVIHVVENVEVRAAQRTGSVSTTRTGRGPATDCNDWDVSFDDQRAVRGEARLTIPNLGAEALEVGPMDGGGIQVQGTERNDFAVTVCKAVAPWTGSMAMLDQISATFENGHLSVKGPSSEHDWNVYLMIQAPRNAAVSLEASNGPIEVYDTAGRVHVRTRNGPIGLRRCSGDLDVEAENGPVSYFGNSGNVRLRTQNGPITVGLLGTAWESGGLHADLSNGPFTLRIPSDFRSGVVVETTNRSPFTCRASACSGAQRTWSDDGRRIEFGRDPVVHVTTVNGPISIENGSGND